MGFDDGCGDQHDWQDIFEYVLITGIFLYFTLKCHCLSFVTLITLKNYVFFQIGTTSSSSHDTPEAIDHVGIICFNRLYEYGHSGVKKSNVSIGI